MTSRVNWGAIFAGAFIGIAAMVFFSLFALATKISGVNVIQPPEGSISLGAAIYAVVTAMVSFAAAGFCTVKLAAIRDPGSAMLHALTSFALAGTLVPMLFTRAMFIGSPGFAVAPPPGMFIEPALAWSFFLSYALAAVACCAAGVQACFSDKISGMRYREEHHRRAA